MPALLAESDQATIYIQAVAMEKEIIAERTSPPRKESPQTDAPVKTLPMDEVKKLIRKVSKDHEGLFRRLAK